MRVSRLALVLLVLVAGELARAAPQDEEPLVRVEVRVSGVTGEAIYVDAGYEAGLAEGDAVRFLPLGAAPREGTLRSVSRSSARAELDGAGPPLELGTPAEVWVPRSRLQDRAGAAEPAPDGAPPDVPEHPPWTHPPEDWSTDTPLLAPVGGVPSSERDMRVDGRLWTRALWIEDGADEKRTYTSLRSGLDLGWENPFGKGGGFDLDLEFSLRRADRDGAPDEDDDELRLERFSYFVGGTRDRPTRWELGRFLSHEFPELGVIDGVEVVHRLESGSRFGASAGFLPEPTDEMETGEDAAAAAFYRKTWGENEDHALGIAYQKTWHEGAADRDLVLVRADSHPTDRLSLHGSAWVDAYTSGDEAKGSGLELTELHLGAVWRIRTASGLGVSVSRRRWPEIERFEFVPVSDEELEELDVRTVAVYGWTPLAERVSLFARADVWEDEDESGGSAEARVALAEALGSRTELALGAFATEAKFHEGLGGRLSASKSWGRGRGSLAWEWMEFEAVSGAAGDATQHLLRASFDTTFARAWTASLHGEQRFGDDVDSTTIGCLLQWTF